MTLKVLVIDDTVVYRKLISEALSEIPGVKVVGTAATGKMALMRIRELAPDLITLDIEMPEMNGVELLEALKQQQLSVGVLVLSGLSHQGGDLTVRAMQLGAFDFIPKPTERVSVDRRTYLRDELAPRIKAFARRQEIQNILAGRFSALPHEPKGVVASSEPVTSHAENVVAVMRPELVAIGISTGGPPALGMLLPQLPADLGVPLFIVQHMPPMFTQSLAESLNQKCAIRVCEACDREIAKPNVAYLAPGGRHMRVIAGKPGEMIVQITDDPPENHCRPSVDYLFRSVAKAFPGRAAAVIMTGMGSDGTVGLRLMKRHGGIVIAQDEASCAVFGMPREAIQAGVVDTILPLESIASEIVRVVRGGGL